MTKREKIQYLKDALYSTKGDNLERANNAFSGMTSDSLDRPYGQSGKTCREMWQEYKDARTEWEEVNDFLNELIHNVQ